MEVKIDDAKKIEAKTRKKKFKMKNNLESKLGKKSRVFRNIMKGAKKVSEKEREVVKKKNNT